MRQKLAQSFYCSILSSLLSLGTAEWLVVRAQCTESILSTETLPSPACSSCIGGNRRKVYAGHLPTLAGFPGCLREQVLGSPTPSPLSPEPGVSRTGLCWRQGRVHIRSRNALDFLGAKGGPQRKDSRYPKFFLSPFALQPSVARPGRHSSVPPPFPDPVKAPVKKTCEASKGQQCLRTNRNL